MTQRKLTRTAKRALLEMAGDGEPVPVRVLWLAKRMALSTTTAGHALGILADLGLAQRNEEDGTLHELTAAGIERARGLH